jgi:hypothetical protein
MYRVSGAELSCGCCLSGQPGMAYSWRQGAPMEGPVLCQQCDKPEDGCKCERYCCHCQGQEGIRLCIDGLYYCPDCREACDVRVVDSRGR